MPWKASVLTVGLLLLSLGLVHASLNTDSGKVQQLDDEGAYIPEAMRLASKHRTSILPGKLPFHHRPPFATVVFARLIEDGPKGSAVALATIRNFNVFLLVVIVLATYLTGLLLNYGPFLSLWPPVLLSLSGSFWVYAHTAHSEILHGAFLAIGLLSLLIFVRTLLFRYLVCAGSALGFALLTRGSLQPVVVALIPFVAVVGYVAGGAGSVPGTRLVRAAFAALALLAGLGLVTGPQLLANWNAGYGPRISANTWRNIEFGLRRRAPGDESDFPALKWSKASRLYHAGGRTELKREAAAKRRTMSFVRAHSIPALASRQVRKVVQRLLVPKSLLEAPELTGRFSHAGRKALSILAAPWRVTWYVVLLLGVVGAAVASRRSMEGRILALFMVAYFLGFLLVPTSRLFIPVVPVLCLTAPSAYYLLPANFWNRLSSLRRRKARS